MDLFSLQEAEAREGFEPGADTSAMPLAARMRPRTLDEVAGQKHLLAPGKLLRRAIETDRFTSLIFYGPPGCGKTTLAAVIARTTNAHFMMLNGVESNVADIHEKNGFPPVHAHPHLRLGYFFPDVRYIGFHAVEHHEMGIRRPGDDGGQSSLSAPGKK